MSISGPHPALARFLVGVYVADSTVSLSPTALVTATNVESRGFMVSTLSPSSLATSPRQRGEDRRGGRPLLPRQHGRQKPEF
jgi:hypothetical protein